MWNGSDYYSWVQVNIGGSKAGTIIYLLYFCIFVLT